MPVYSSFEGFFGTIRFNQCHDTFAREQKKVQFLYNSLHKNLRHFMLALFVVIKAKYYTAMVS